MTRTDRNRVARNRRRAAAKAAKDAEDAKDAKDEDQQHGSVLRKYNEEETNYSNVAQHTFTLSHVR